MTTCATCGTSLEPVSLLTSVTLTDMDEDGNTMTLLFGRVCGHAAALLSGATVRAHERSTGEQVPSRHGRGPKARPANRPVVDPATDTALAATSYYGPLSRPDSKPVVVDDPFRPLTAAAPPLEP